MDDKVRERIKMLYALVERGTDGEKVSAKRTLDALLRKYNLEDINLEDIDKPVRKFKYSSVCEMWLLSAIIKYFVAEDAIKHAKRYLHQEKAIGLPLNHIDYVTVECAYEYFRRHMKVQWKKTCEPELKKCRKVKTRNKRRAELQEIFADRYIIASKLIPENRIVEVDINDMSAKEIADRMKLAGVQGGTYNVQMEGGYALPEHTPSKKINEQLNLF